jgi:hypothetical protein
LTRQAWRRIIDYLGAWLEEITVAYVGRMTPEEVMMIYYYQDSFIVEHRTVVERQMEYALSSSTSPLPTAQITSLDMEIITDHREILDMVLGMTLHLQAGQRIGERRQAAAAHTVQSLSTPVSDTYPLSFQDRNYSAMYLHYELLLRYHRGESEDQDLRITPSDPARQLTSTSLLGRMERHVFTPGDDATLGWNLAQLHLTSVMPLEQAIPAPIARQDNTPWVHQRLDHLLTIYRERVYETMAREIGAPVALVRYVPFIPIDLANIPLMTLVRHQPTITRINPQSQLQTLSPTNQPNNNQATKKTRPADQPTNQPS